MRFDKETRAKIQEAAPGSVTIPWPTGAPQPEKERTYRVQAIEDVEKAEHRLKAHPETCRDVMAEMHYSNHGRYPKGYKPPRPKLRRPSREDPCILVTDVEVLEVGKGYLATVILWEEGDPIRHTGLKTRVEGGLDPLSTIAGDPITGHTPTETESEQIITQPSRREREEADDALKLEHEASVDSAKIAEAQRKLKEQRRKGKPGKLAAMALEKAKRRAESVAEAA